jgi:hypothetical protein
VRRGNRRVRSGDRETDREEVSQSRKGDRMIWAMATQHT